MEGTDQDIQEIGPPVINRIKHKKVSSKDTHRTTRPLFLPSQQKKCSQTADH
jgi:hypothetical protein